MTGQQSTMYSAISSPDKGEGAMPRGGTFGEKKEQQMVFHERTWS